MQNIQPLFFEERISPESQMRFGGNEIVDGDLLREKEMIYFIFCESAEVGRIECLE